MRGTFVCILLSTAVFTPSVSAQEEASETLDICAVDNDYFFYERDGDYGGLEYDILRGFATDAGREISIRFRENWQWQQSPAEALRTGSCDVVAMTLTITEERMQRMDFSTPYFPVRVVVVEPQGRFTADLESLVGKRVATMPNFLITDTLREHPGIDLIYGESTRALFEIVDAGAADALVVDSWTVFVHAADFPKLRVTAAITETEFFGLALKRGGDLTAQINAYIDRIKADGSFRNLLVRNFGDDNAGVVAEGLGLE